MAITIEQILSAKGIHPTKDNLDNLEKKWREIEQLKGDLEGIAIDDADIALKNIAGRDHHE